MIRRLRVVPVAAALGLLLGCGSPTTPEVPNPDPADKKDDEEQEQGFLLDAPARDLTTLIELV